MQGPILIRNCRLIDGVSETPKEEMDVLLEDGRVASVHDHIPHADDVTSSDMSPSNASLIDATGKTLLPGLIDTHVHLTLDASLDPIGHLRGEGMARTLLKSVAHAGQYLRRGVTTVRDLASPSAIGYALRDAIEDGIVSGPRVVASGRPITITGGHLYFMGHEADDPLSVLRAAREEIKAGADVIKVMATGGALTPGSSVTVTQYRRDDLQPAVAEARARGLKVAAHANGLEGLRAAVEAGVASIEHGSYADRAVLGLMAERGTVLVPTMAPARIILEGPRAGRVSADRAANASRNWRARQQAVQNGIELGVPMAAGTDAGVTLTDHGILAFEIETFEHLGMSPMQAIWTATRTAAELLGLEEQIGRIAPGMVADLILVAGDPLLDLTRLRSPEMVFKAGRIVGGALPPWPQII